MEQCSRVLFSLRQPRHSPLSHELQIKWLRQAAKPALLKLYAAPLKLSASGKATEHLTLEVRFPALRVIILCRIR